MGLTNKEIHTFKAKMRCTTWPSLSLEAKDFVKRILNKDPRKRISAAHALSDLFFLPLSSIPITSSKTFFKLSAIILCLHVILGYEIAIM